MDDSHSLSWEDLAKELVKLNLFFKSLKYLNNHPTKEYLPMSINGSFEVNTLEKPLHIKKTLSEYGFNFADIEEVDWGEKRYLINLNSFNRPDLNNPNWLKDVVHVAHYLLDIATDEEVFYCQDWKLRDPNYKVEIKPQRPTQISPFHGWRSRSLCALQG